MRLRCAAPIDHTRMKQADFSAILHAANEHCNSYLEDCLPKSDQEPTRLHQAMRYAVFAGGKRLRPALIMTCCEALGGQVTACLPLMGGIELLHTYTLVHDDLPAMDDDVLRRGKPTCHVAFDEATAILCGDALLTLALSTVAEHSAEAVRLLGHASGSLGVVGGQQDDLDAAARPLDDQSEALLQRIHSRKTAALLAVSCELGALAADASSTERAAIARYGHEIGMAFQITDDILDVKANSDELGKTVGKDADQDKLTSVRLYGMDGAQARAQSHIDNALAAIAGLDEKALSLRKLAEFILVRSS